MTVEQNTLKRRGVGLRACDPERAYPGFTLFATLFVENRTVYLIDLQGEIVHRWNMPYSPGLSGYLTERGRCTTTGALQRLITSVAFRSRVAWRWKQTGPETYFGKYAIQTITMTGFCCAMETSCWIA